MLSHVFLFFIIIIISFLEPDRIGLKRTRQSFLFRNSYTAPHKGQNASLCMEWMVVVFFSEPNFHSSCFAFKACPRLSYHLEKIWFKVILLEARAKEKPFAARSRTPGIKPHCDGEIQGDCSHNSVRWVAACYLFKAGTVTLFDAYWFECARTRVRDRWAKRTPASMRRVESTECFGWAADYFRACAMECLVWFFMANLLPYVSRRTRSSTERGERRESRRVGSVSVSSNSCSLHW